MSTHDDEALTWAGDRDRDTTNITWSAPKAGKSPSSSRKKRTSKGDASTSSARGTVETASRVEPVETHAPQSATEAIDAAIESVTPIVAAPSYVARFADEAPLATPVSAFPVEQNQDEVLTAPLDVPVLDVPQSQAPRQDAPPKRASDDIPRADALDDE